MEWNFHPRWRIAFETSTPDPSLVIEAVHQVLSKLHFEIDISISKL